jgi:hypothetical protein
MAVTPGDSEAMRAAIPLVISSYWFAPWEMNFFGTTGRSLGDG